MLQIQAAVKGLRVFNMKYLYTAEQSDVIASLRQFLSLYGECIEEKKRNAHEEQFADYKEAAEKNLNTCENLLNRIYHSVICWKKRTVMHGKRSNM